MSNVGKMSQVLNAYPVGSIYMSVNSTNPGELFGGTWEQIQGRFLLGQGSGYSAGATGGEASHILTIAEMPAHNHNTPRLNGDSNYPIYFPASWGASLKGQSLGVATQVTTNNGFWFVNQTNGSGSAHNNMPPYLVVYIWKRTA